MPGLVPGIYVFNPEAKDVDGRNKSGHDGFGNPYFNSLAKAYARKPRALR